MELSEGYAVGPYRLVARAGSGGMADVWRAYDARLKRYVAIKFLSPRYATDELYLERFRHEAQAISRLDHPNILTIYDYGEQEGWTYMVSPYVGGGTLAAQLRRGPWSVEEAVAVLDPLASALDYAHAEGIVHRDVKPSNVLFTERGRLVLTDFGIARIIERSTLVTQAGLVVGTPMYMSPEQADGQPVTGASDRYSLGVVAYEMLTGRPPFLADTPLALLRAHIDKPLPPPRSVNTALPEPVEAALFTIMAKEPAHRFASGRAFVTALRASATVPAPAPTPLPSRRDAPTDPTLPLDASDVQLDPSEPISGEAEARRQGRTGPTPPTAPTLPMDETVPLRDDERGGHRREPRSDAPSRDSLIAPLAVIAAAWALAWCLVLGMRYMNYEWVYRAVGSWPPGDDAPWISVRFLVAGIAGFVGGAGICAGLLLAGRRLPRSDIMILVVGWALSYAVVHAGIYLLARGMADVRPVALDNYLTYLSYRDAAPSTPSLVFAHLADVAPALLGGCITAYVLYSAIRRFTIWPILGWTLGAAIALLVAAPILYLGDQDLSGLTSSFRGYGMFAGVLAGLVQGLVGGWFTLTGLRRPS